MHEAMKEKFKTETYHTEMTKTVETEYRTRRK